MKKNFYILILSLIFVAVQYAYADYYTQTLTLGNNGSEYKENIINTTPSPAQTTPYTNTIQYVQPVVYPAYYSLPIITTYTHYPHGYFNYNRSGLSIGYNSNYGYSPNPMPIQPNHRPPHPTIGGTKIYEVGPSYGKSYPPSSLVVSPTNPIMPPVNPPGNRPDIGPRHH